MASPWQRAALHAAWITAAVLALFTYWFAIADRYAVFLYEHMGAAPFDATTRSRYWMAGLVASGAVLVAGVLLFGAAGWLARRNSRRYKAPDPRRVWRLAALPVALGVLAITMTVNAPVLPVGLALACAASTLAGLAVAVAPVRLAGEAPGRLVWLALDGLGVAAVLQLGIALGLPARALIGVPLALAVTGGALLGGALWLAALGFVQRRRGVRSPSGAALFAAGCAWTYLLLPLAHHLFATSPGYRYITAASNFFAGSLAAQLLTWGLAAGLAWGAALFRRKVRDPGARFA